jgi:serine/threonine protein kinase
MPETAPDPRADAPRADITGGIIAAGMVLPESAPAPTEELMAGRYRIERRLARGGQASVYLAYQVPLNRPVALKVLVPPPDAASRLSILLLELARVPTSSSPQHAPDLPLLQALTEGFSGAEVVAVVSEAAMLALDAGLDVVPGALLEEAARKTKPQISKEMMEFYHGLSF